MTNSPGTRVHERWAHLRFSVIGHLLAAPPDNGELKPAIEALAARTWRHPATGEPTRFGFSGRARSVDCNRGSFGGIDGECTEKMHCPLFRLDRASEPRGGRSVNDRTAQPGLALHLGL